MDEGTVWGIVGVVGVVVGIGVTVAYARPAKPKVGLKVQNAFATYPDRLGDWCVSIDAINTGGAAVTISGFGFLMPGGESLVTIGLEPGSTPLPHRLEPHAGATLMMQAQVILDECAKRGLDPSQLKSWVRFQTGQVVYGAAPPIEPK